MRIALYTFLLIWLCPCLPQQAWAKPENITLATHNHCPYGCYDHDGNFDGYAVQTVRYALDKMKITLNLIVVPWERAQRMSRDEKVDGFFSASQSEERDRHGVISVDITTQKWNWYQLKDNPLDPNSKDFKQKALVAAFIGSNMLKWLKNNDYKVIADPPPAEHMFNMLLHKRFDAMLSNDLHSELYIREHNISNQIKSSFYKDMPVGVYFTNNFLKKHPDFLTKFNKYVKEYQKLYPLQENTPNNIPVCPNLKP